MLRNPLKIKEVLLTTLQEEYPKSHSIIDELDRSIEPTSKVRAQQLRYLLKELRKDSNVDKELATVRRLDKELAEVESAFPKRSAKKTTAKKTSVRKTYAKKTSTQKTSTKKTSAKKTSAKKTSAKKTSAKKTSAKKTSSKKMNRVQKSYPTLVSEHLARMRKKNAAYTLAEARDYVSKNRNRYH